MASQQGNTGPLRLIGVSALAWFAAACAAGRVEPGPEHPALVFPAHFAEGHQDDAEPEQGRPGEPKLPAQTQPEPPAPARNTLPDPSALRLAEQWHLLLRYDRGTIIVAKRELVTHSAPVVTERKLGRFALELWIGHELIERVRFDFPLLAAEPPPSGAIQPLDESPRFAPGALVEQEVLLPNSPRATRLILVDRATGKTTPLPWPLAPKPDADAAQPAAPSSAPTPEAVSPDPTTAPTKGNQPGSAKPSAER